MTQSDAMPTKPFRAIIVGAGIVGLSLSHAFQLANIDHVVLEKYDKVKSLKGAALIIWPGTERVFDQFGFLSNMLKTTTPVITEHKRWPDGSLHLEQATMDKFHKLFNVPPILFDRQACVAHLYDNLPDQSTIKLNKRVETIEHTETSVRVILADGTIEEGDIVIGADGVHSAVRPQMWDFASKTDPSLIPESDKSVLFSEYDALFGVSDLKGSHEDWGMEAAETNVIYGRGVTKLLFQQQGKQMWAIVFKDKFNQPPKRSKATEEEVEAVAHKFYDLALNEKIKFKDVWEARTRAGLLTLEEGTLSQWHAGRIVLVGDSAHKMTADLALGANIAVEDAVVLSNLLHHTLKSNLNHHPAQSELTSLFNTYQNKRYHRAKIFSDISGKTTRANSYDTLLGRLFATYISPWTYETRVKKLALAWAKAPKLDYVPVRTVDESAPGWSLGDEEGNGGALWALWAGFAALGAGLVVRRFGMPRL